MAPKTPKDDSNKDTNKELSEGIEARVLRNRGPRLDTAPGSPLVPSNRPPEPDGGIPSGRTNGNIMRPREVVNEKLGKQRQHLIGEIRKTEKAAEIPELERHFRDQAMAKELNEVDRNEVVARAKKSVVGIRNFTRKARLDAHERRRIATSLYEDFLFYQTPEYRLQYGEEIDGTNGKRSKPMRENLPPGLLAADPVYDKKLRPMVTSFERDGVGMTEEIGYENMGPDNLHVRLPRARRVAVGLGRPRKPPRLSPIEMHLDLEAIEKRRGEIEDANSDHSPTEESHSKRRRRDSKLLLHLPTAKDLSRARLESGLHIAAGETSFDWEESYDQRGVVAPGRMLNMPAKLATERSGEKINEFSKPATMPVEYDASVGHDHIETTAGAEATDGRRERERDEVMRKMHNKDFEYSDKDSSEDEGDLFASSYHQCNGLEDCPCSSEDKGDSGHDDSSGHGDNGGPGNDGANGIERGEGQILPLSVVGGSLIAPNRQLSARGASPETIETLNSS
ncbi:hypothetical protein G6011_11776 [Alternaria panax]|uniref:Uncharacterized protein n=1 Tax=Alternaria panax TaxID=48097 RepID=A0AAD4I609_9PLEO|nr:hypothetical protein G6011_11776 [Alternaria panax]